MTALDYPSRRRPPGLYRLARGLRAASILVLVVVLLYTATVAYSAIETARSGSNLSNLNAEFQANNTVLVTGTLTLSNGGFYSVHDLSLSVRVTNESGVLIGAARLGPQDLASQATSFYTLDLYFPAGGAGPGPSLMTHDQSLPVYLWANGTFGYLFPISAEAQERRSWGAPFANLAFSIGTPIAGPGGATVPVTLSFQNHAQFSEVGTLAFALRSSTGATCGAGGFTLNVAPGEPFTQTSSVALAAGCSPAGGSVDSSFTTPSYSVPLPPEAIP